MLYVESSVACDGPSASYQSWSQYLHTRRQARLIKFNLPGAASRVENLLGLPDVHDPLTILGLAATIRTQSDQLERLGMPAVTSVVRLCNRTSHRDGVNTAYQTGRPEAAARIVWMLQGTHQATVPVHAKLVNLNKDGIGNAQALNQHIGKVSPVVSAAVTMEEQRAYDQLSETAVVSALPSTRADNSIYALIHPLGEAEILERFYFTNVL